MAKKKNKRTRQPQKCPLRGGLTDDIVSSAVKGRLRCVLAIEDWDFLPELRFAILQFLRKWEKVELWPQERLSDAILLDNIPKRESGFSALRKLYRQSEPQAWEAELARISRRIRSDRRLAKEFHDLKETAVFYVGTGQTPAIGSHRSSS